MLKKFLMVASFFLLFACSDDAAVSQSAQTQSSSPEAAAAQPVAAADHFLVFFLDPNGGPCRMQSSILDGMADELNGKVNLRYIQTTVKDDLQYFYAYGVRGLPLLLLADSNGKEIKRLPPGVNPAEAIRELLKSLPN